jgi:hypothetical protein
MTQVRDAFNNSAICALLGATQKGGSHMRFQLLFHAKTQIQFLLGRCLYLVFPYWLLKT